MGAGAAGGAGAGSFNLSAENRTFLATRFDPPAGVVMFMVLAMGFAALARAAVAPLAEMVAKEETVASCR